MGLFLVGLFVFFGLHIFPHFATARSGLKEKLGERKYKGIYSLISIFGLVLIVMGKGDAPYVHVFSPPPWGRHLTMTLMLASTLCFAAIYLPTNLKRITAHPMLWAVAAWSAGHLLSNGDLASLLLFGAFLAYALFDMWSANQRGAAPRKEPVPVSRDVLVGAVALVAYAAFLFLHPYLFGVAVLHG